VVYLAEDGREIEFDVFDHHGHRLEVGASIWQPIERLTLKRLSPERWEMTDIAGRCLEFEAGPGFTSGRAMLRSETSRCGFHQIRYQYDPRGRLHSVIDSAGRTIGLTYNPEGRLSVLSLPHSVGGTSYSHRRYFYDDEGDLVQVTDALGSSWHFEYATHLLVQETDRNGLSFYFAYDGLGEDAYCIRTWGDDGLYDHVILYDKQNKATFVTNSLGHTTQYHMNLVGQVVTIVDPLGAETHYRYDPETLQKLEARDALGRTTRFQYDARGNLLELEEPTGAITRLTYDKGLDLPSSGTDPLGGEWRWAHDRHGRRTQQRDPLGRVFGYQYTDGWLSGLLDPAGQTSRLSFDRQGNLTRLLQPDQGELRWRYDTLGRPIEAIDPLGNVRRRRFDLEGRVIWAEEPDGNVRALVYDGEGSVVRARDEQHDVHVTYQGMGRLASRSEAGTTVRFEYDTEEQLTGIVNEHGHVYRFEYDEAGEVSVEEGFDGILRRFKRDKAGQVLEVIRPTNRHTAYEYDAAGRVTSVRHDDGSQEIYRFRLDGMLEEATNPHCTVLFERDALGRITRELQGEYWIASDYDALGMRSTMTSSLGADQRITRNVVGEVLEVASSDYRVGFERDAQGLELSRSLPGGLVSRWERDRLGRPFRHCDPHHLAVRAGELLADGATGRGRELFDRDRLLGHAGADGGRSRCEALVGVDLGVWDAAGCGGISEDRLTKSPRDRCARQRMGCCASATAGFGGGRRSRRSGPAGSAPTVPVPLAGTVRRCRDGLVLQPIPVL